MLYGLCEGWIDGRQCQSNQSKAESIECNWTQWNDCDSIVERNQNSIKYYYCTQDLLSIVECNRINITENFTLIVRFWGANRNRPTHGKFFQNINFRGWVIQANSWRNCAIFTLQNLIWLSIDQSQDPNRTQLNVTQKVAVWLRFDCIWQSNRNYLITFYWVWCRSIGLMSFDWFDCVQLTLSGNIQLCFNFNSSCKPFMADGMAKSRSIAGKV